LIADIAAQRSGGAIAHLEGQAREIADAVPEEQRELISTALLLVGWCLSYGTGQDPLNLLGVTACELSEPLVKGVRR